MVIPTQRGLRFLLSFILFAGSSLAASVTSLELDDPVFEAAAGDFDGDGDDDLLLLSEKGWKLMSLEEGKLQPSLRGQLPDLRDDWVLYDLFDVDGSGSVELLGLDAEGISIYELSKGGEVVRMAERRLPDSLLSQLGLSSRDEVERRTLAYRPSGASSAVLAIPQLQGYEFLVLRGGELVSLGAFEGGFVHSLNLVFGRMSARSHISEPIVVDMNRDGREDLVLAARENLHVYLQDEDGLFDPELKWLAPLPFLHDPNENQRMKDLEGREAATLIEVGDFDGDEAADLLAQKFIDGGGSIFDAASEVRLHRGHLYERDGEMLFRVDWQPSSVISMEGIQTSFEVNDLGGDGILDLSLLSTRIGLLKIVRILMSGKTGLDAEHYFGTSTGLPREPSEKQSLTIRFSFEAGARTQPLMQFHDIDSDGDLDLLLGRDADELAVYQWRREGFTERPVQRIKVPLPAEGGQVQTADFDGDGRLEIWFLSSPDDRPDETESTVTLIRLN